MCMCLNPPLQIPWDLHSEVKWSHSVMPNSLWPHGLSLPGSSVHGILQARILEWVAISFSRGSSRPRDRTQISHFAGRWLLWATREALPETYINQGKYNPNNPIIHVLCAHVLKKSNNEPIINKPEVTLWLIQKNLWSFWRKGWLVYVFS